MKKIMLVGNHDLVIYNFRIELIERLLKEKYEVYIVLPYGEKVDLMVEMGCKFIDTPIERHGTNPVTELKLIMLYKKIIDKVKPNIVFLYTIKPDIYMGMVCRLSKIPYIANMSGLGTAIGNPGIMQKLTLFLLDISYKKAQKVFFQNEQNRKFLLSKNIAVDNNELLPGSGVNLNRFKLIDYPTDDSIEFLFIARIMKEKGIDQYLEAAEYIHNKYPQTVFHVLGFFEEDYNKEKFIELENKKVIIYHGMQKDIIPFLKISHCTIHPSYYPEGISNVCLETCACGRPVITTDWPGCRETVDNGITGFIFKPKNTESLIEKIEEFINTPNEEKRVMGLMARKKVEREFDRNIVVNAYVEEIEEKWVSSES